MNEKLIRLWATKNKNDEWWSSFFASPLAIAVNYAVVDIKWITPNLITLFSFITAIISVLFILTGGEVSFIIAALFIQCSYVLDCMDGQMARYRKTTSITGNFFDKLTDQVQISIWFGSIGYTAYAQSQNVLPLVLALTGIALYSLRGYSKYLAFYLEMSRDSKYLEKLSRIKSGSESREEASSGLGFGILTNLRWFVGEQRKILAFNEGVLIFMLSLALVLNMLIPMLWIFAIGQFLHCLIRTWQRKCQLERNQLIVTNK